MKVAELIEKLKQLPQDADVRFYDCQWEHAYWNITDIEVDSDGDIILSDTNFI
jgi:hypothetical protein